MKELNCLNFNLYKKDEEMNTFANSFLNIFYSKFYSNKRYYEKFNSIEDFEIELYAPLLSRTYGNDYNQKILRLISDNYITRNDSYLVNAYCKHFKCLVNIKKTDKIKKYNNEFTNKLNKNLDKLFIENEKINQESKENLMYQNELIEKGIIKFNDISYVSKTLNSYKNNEIINKKTGEKEINLSKYYSQSAIADNILNKRTVKAVDSRGRMYNSLTNLTRELRENIVINDKNTINYDLSCSQYQFLAIEIYTKYYQNFTKQDKINFNFFLKVLKEHDLYKFVADKLNITRNEVKQSMMKFLYRDENVLIRRNCLDIDERICLVFKMYFPSVYSVLKYEKRNKIKANEFCDRIVKQEVKVFNEISNKLIEKNEAFFTVHDSITISENSELKKEIENVLKKYGLKFKSENGKEEKEKEKCDFMYVFGRDVKNSIYVNNDNIQKIVDTKRREEKERKEIEEHNLKPKILEESKKKTLFNMSREEIFKLLR